MERNICKVTTLINLLSIRHFDNILVNSWNGEIKFARPSNFENYGFGTALSSFSKSINEVVQFMSKYIGLIHYRCNAINFHQFMETSPDFLRKMFLEEKGEIANFSQLKEILYLLNSDI